MLQWMPRSHFACHCPPICHHHVLHTSQEPRGNGRFLFRTVAEKNGQGSNPWNTSSDRFPSPPASVRRTLVPFVEAPQSAAAKGRSPKIRRMAPKVLYTSCKATRLVSREPDRCLPDLFGVCLGGCLQIDKHTHWIWL